MIRATGEQFSWEARQDGRMDADMLSARLEFFIQTTCEAVMRPVASPVISFSQQFSLKLLLAQIRWCGGTNRMEHTARPTRLGEVPQK